VGRDVRPHVAVDKLIRACSVDPPVKYTVVRVLGCAHRQAVLRYRRQPAGRGARRHVDDAWLAYLGGLNVIVIAGQFDAGPPRDVAAHRAFLWVTIYVSMRRTVA
jgi:hypothetical protein